MVENGFVSLVYLLSYPGIVAVSWLITEFIKKIVPVWENKQKTRMIVLVVIFIMVSIRTALLVSKLESYEFEPVLTIIVEWLFNIPLLWLTVMKAHETIIEKK